MKPLDNGGTEKPRGLLSRRSAPKLLKKAAGGEKCCIFRIPHRPENNNQNDYEPRVVSIGPYHHGKKHLEMIQEHKHGYLELFMEEARKRNVEMKDLIEAVSLLEEDIMDSYSENLDLGDGFDRNDLIDMMVLDGCFILMLFFVVAKEVEYSEFDDPIFKMRWILPAIRKDLLLLENQVPFFLLQTIFDKSKIVTSCGLNKITLEFFKCSIEKLVKSSLEHRDIKAKHLLDLIRKTLIPLKPARRENQDSGSRPFLTFISSAKDLQFLGVIFKCRYKPNTLLDVRLNTKTAGITVEIPTIVLDDFVISLLRNCVAFEQFHGGCTNHIITSYITFMGCLIGNEDDAKFLKKRGIMEKHVGTGEEIFEFFKVIGKDIFIDLHESYLAEVFEGINEYYAGGGPHVWNHWKAILSNTYFSDPWAFHSFFSGGMLFILTVLQAYLAAYPYINPSKDKK